MKQSVLVNREMLTLILDHFTPDEIRHAEEEYNIELDGTPIEDMTKLYNDGDKTHIAYPLLFLQSQLNTQSNDD